MGIIDFTRPITGNFIVDIMVWLVSITSSIALGVVLFTLILKLITLPFDFFSRASMRKNSLKMEEMRPELEKLQKQYADNKDLYNQKMMALYKKNGYSMFGACLPTILTLVIFIVALNGFTAYSQYQNKLYFYNMSVSYNNVVYEGIEEDGEYIVKANDGTEKVSVSNDKLVALYNRVIDTTSETPDTFTSNDVTITAEIDGTHLYISTLNGYVKYGRSFEVKDGVVSFNAAVDIKVKELTANSIKSEINNNLLNSAGDDFNTAYSKEIQRIQKLNADNKENADWVVLAEPTELEYTSTFINDIQSYMAAKTYRNEQAGFLWIKNLWATDSPMKHPVETSWATFKQAHAYGLVTDNDIGQDNYDKLTYHLAAEKVQPNGYFILVAITAGMSFLMQFVTNKSQKAQMELQTVDGQGAQTQKIMMWMMPIMMAIFAFMYTSAFSIYIILSNALSMATTFLINFVVDRSIKRKKAKESKGNEETIRGRVYTPKEEPKVDKKKEKKEKNNKAKDSNTGDFLSGTADNKKKHIRGRIK